MMYNYTGYICIIVVMKLKKVALIVNFDKKNAVEVATALINELRNKAAVYCLDEDSSLLPGAVGKKEAELFSTCPVVAVLGGDGTIITTAKNGKAINNDANLEITGGKITVASEDAIGVYNSDKATKCTIQNAEILLEAEVIDNYEEIMQDENPEHKALDFVLTKNNEFLFVSQDYDDQIDLTSEHRNKIIKKIPATTDSMFNNKKKFVKLSKKEFLKLIEEDK